jgi:hypothetical protein
VAVGYALLGIYRDFFTLSLRRLMLAFTRLRGSLVGGGISFTFFHFTASAVRTLNVNTGFGFVRGISWRLDQTPFQPNVVARLAFRPNQIIVRR